MVSVCICDPDGWLYSAISLKFACGLVMHPQYMSTKSEYFNVFVEEIFKKVKRQRKIYHDLETIIVLCPSSNMDCMNVILRKKYSELAFQHSSWSFKSETEERNQHLCFDVKIVKTKARSDLPYCLAKFNTQFSLSFFKMFKDKWTLF